MNKPVTAADLVTPKVTTGPLIGSRKAYANPESAPDLRVPIREIVLSKESGEPPLPVYDTSGVYTDNDVAIDVETGAEVVSVGRSGRGNGSRSSAGSKYWPACMKGLWRSRHPV